MVQELDLMLIYLTDNMQLILLPRQLQAQQIMFLILKSLLQQEMQLTVEDRLHLIKMVQQQLHLIMLTQVHKQVY